MKLNSIQFFANTSMMISMMFIPVIAEDFGANHIQIGIIVGVYGLCLFISSYLFSRAADAWNIKKLLVAGLAFSAVAYLLQVFANDPFSLGLARGFLGICVGIYPAAMIMHVYGMGRSIGKFSSFGALGWAVGFFVAGLIGNYDLIFVASAVLMILSAIIAMRLPDVKVPRINVEYLSLATVKANWDIYLTFMLRHTGASAIWVIFPLYLISLGANEFWIGTIYCINPLVQFFIMRRLDGRDSVLLVRYGCLVSVVAFLSFIPPTTFYYIMPGMILVAVSWSFLYVGSTELLLSQNQDKATAAGWITSVISLASVVGSLLGGIISYYGGFVSVLVFAGGLSFISFRIMASRPHPHPQTPV
ncbi:MAG: MFS transporter [Methanosarcinales archaeon]|nr:MAG: MFS transporter [Methanosarcinales archaeon]